MTDMGDHIVNIPTNDERIEIVLDHLTKNAKKETWMRQSDMKKSADDILKIIEESFQILLGKKGGNSNNERILTERFVDGVRGYQLKRKLRRFSMENPSMPFIEFRGRVLYMGKWSKAKFTEMRRFNK